MNNKPKFSNEAGPPASISRNPPALTIYLAWSEARLVSRWTDALGCFSLLSTNA